VLRYASYKFEIANGEYTSIPLLLANNYLKKGVEYFIKFYYLVSLNALIFLIDDQYSSYTSPIKYTIDIKSSFFG
jgi:hypothetical protein